RRGRAGGARVDTGPRLARLRLGGGEHHARLGVAADPAQQLISGVTRHSIDANIDHVRPHTYKNPRTLYGSRGIIATARAVRRGYSYSPRTHRPPSGPIRVGRRVRRRSVYKLSNGSFIATLIIYPVGVLVKRPLSLLIVFFANRRQF